MPVSKEAGARAKQVLSFSFWIGFYIRNDHGPIGVDLKVWISSVRLNVE
jgi:hypothetical protein